MSKMKEMAFGDKPYQPLGPGFKEQTTSRDAAASVASRSVTLRQRAYDLIRQSSRTPDEVAEALGETVLAVRPRITELAKSGKITDTGERRANRSGKMAKVWRVA